jgi:hypothetical protein
MAVSAGGNAPQFSPGFRLSLVDGLILAAGISAAVFAPHPINVVVGTAVGHFFLFCNVFRMSRPPELVWACTFMLLSGTTLLADAPGWWATVSISFGLAVVLIALETRKPRYHGVGWRRLNPQLPEWWRARTERAG